MSQSYIGWRLRRLFEATGKGLSSIARRFLNWLHQSPLAVGAICISSVLVLPLAALFYGKHPPEVHAPPAPPQAPPQPPPPPAPPPPVSPPAPPPAPASKAYVRFAGWLRTGADDIDIVVDDQGGCEWLVIKGTPVPRMRKMENAPPEQWCDTPTVGADVSVPDDQPDSK